MLLVVNMVLVNVCLSHPENLECGTDATTRLDLGAVIMQGAVSKAFPLEKKQLASFPLRCRFR